jgi:hypothetical protein
MMLEMAEEERPKGVDAKRFSEATEVVEGCR